MDYLYAVVLLFIPNIFHFSSNETESLSRTFSVRRKKYVELKLRHKLELLCNFRKNIENLMSTFWSSSPVIYFPRYSS